MQIGHVSVTQAASTAGGMPQCVTKGETSAKLSERQVTPAGGPLLTSSRSPTEFGRL